VFEEARELGLNVSNDMPKEIMQMMVLFPDTVRRTPSVRYVEDEAKSVVGENPHKVTMTGAQPQMGRSFSYGPWNPKELKSQREPEAKRKPFWRRGE